MSTISTSLFLGSDLEVNRLGYGAMHLTGHGYWGDPDDVDNAIRVLRRAIDLGVTFIDTADSYGLGANERIIRRALYPYPEELVITTKGGLLRSGPQDWLREHGDPYIVPLGRPEYLRQQVEASLWNLGVDQIDLYQLHRVDPTVRLADQLGELARLQQQGKIRHIGISGQPGVDADTLREAAQYVDIVAVENLYNVARRDDEPTLRYAEQHEMTFIPWFPLGHGDLLGPDSGLNQIASDYAATASQLALAWLLHHSPATLVIPGTTSVDHLEDNMRAAHIQLTDEDVNSIADRVDAVLLTAWRPV